MWVNGIWVPKKNTWGEDYRRDDPPVFLFWDGKKWNETTSFDLAFQWAKSWSTNFQPVQLQLNL